MTASTFKAISTPSPQSPSSTSNGTVGVSTLPTSVEGSMQLQAQVQKKRRIPGACDICKKKKIRCDSGEMPGNRCSNCIQYGLECTHKEVTKTLGSAKGYVESLEARLEKMDKLLTRLLPGIDLTQEIDRLLEEVDEANEPSRYDEDGDDTTEMIGRLAKLDLNPPQNRFFGKSSGYQLIQTALDLKSQYNGTQIRAEQSVLKYRRPEFWEIPTWTSFDPETEDTSRQYAFPPSDLIPSLVSHYFTQINPFLPLLHRPTFEKGIVEGLYLTDAYFGATVLLVCALGSRYSDDPRVFVEGSNSTRSAGWKWFEQVRVLRSSFFNRTSLYELQAYALSILFSQSSEIPQGTWSQVGMALRLAQEVGAHRRRSQSGSSPTGEDELWKRAFWVLVCIDRLTSSFAGRPCGLQDEDFDLDLPIECDDEFWKSSDLNDCFSQPAGQPSTIVFFNCYLGLMDILAYAMRAIYAIKRPKNMFGTVIQRSEQQIIAELDSAMNNWMDSVPQHLRWNPSSNNLLFIKQSAALYATYYHLQIFIHRPFIPSPRNRTPVTFPSLAICTNAARSCCHVLESYSRISNFPLPHLLVTTFTVAVILLLNIWSGKRTGFAPNPKREMEDVQRCMNMLKSCEKRWSKAGRYRDILTELAYAGDVTISNHLPPSSSPSRKRRRTISNDLDHSPFPTSVTANHSIPDGLILNASSPRAISATPTPTSRLPPDTTPPNFSLPMYSTELGRLPVYGQFNFLDTTTASHQETVRHVFPTPTNIPGHYLSQQRFLPSAPLDSRLCDRGNPRSSSAATVPGLILSGNEGLLSFSDPLMLGAFADGHLNRNSDAQMDVSSMLSPIPASASAAAAISELNTMDSPANTSGGPSTELPLLDHDTMTMWSTAPTNFELDEWKAYISSVNQITHGFEHSI